MRTYKPGCWADGAYGHEHVRRRLAELVREFDENIADELLKPMSDDASEEMDALQILNDNTIHPNYYVVWEFVDGDLMLSKLISENSGGK